MFKLGVFILQPNFYKTSYFSQILTWGTSPPNHHLCFPFNQHLVKSGCKIKFPNSEFNIVTLRI